jgi:hypothetical protein
VADRIFASTPCSRIGRLLFIYTGLEYFDRKWPALERSAIESISYSKHSVPMRALTQVLFVVPSLAVAAALSNLRRIGIVFDLASLNWFLTPGANAPTRAAYSTLSAPSNRDIRACLGGWRLEMWKFLKHRLRSRPPDAPAVHPGRSEFPLQMNHGGWARGQCPSDPAAGIALGHG